MESWKRERASPGSPLSDTAHCRTIHLACRASRGRFPLAERTVGRVVVSRGRHAVESSDLLDEGAVKSWQLYESGEPVAGTIGPHSRAVQRSSRSLVAVGGWCRKDDFVSEGGKMSTRAGEAVGV